MMMTKIRPVLNRIALNSLWLLMARISSQGLMFVFSVLVARHLGQGGLGQYAFVVAVVFLGNVLTTFGLDTLLIREIAQQSVVAAPLVTAALTIQLGLSALFIGAVTLASAWLALAPTTVLALRLYSLSLIPLAFTTAFSATLRARERMDLILALNLLSATAQTGGAGLLLWSGGDLVALIIFLLMLQALTALAAGAMCFGWLPGFVLDLHVGREVIERMLRHGAPLALLAGSMVAYQRLGILMLSFMAGDAVTGWFTAAARVTDGFKMIHYAFFGAIFPLMSRLAVAERLPGLDGNFLPLERRLSQYSFPFLLGFGVLVGLVSIPLAGPVVRLLYGADYAPAIGALRVLAWSLIPFAINTYTFFWLVSQAKEMSALKVGITSLVSAAVLYGLLIPPFGLLGASMATLAGEIIQTLLYLPHTWQARMGQGDVLFPSESGSVRGKEVLS